MKKIYLLMDARVAFEPDRATVMLSGSAKECCQAANNGEYGTDCVVCGSDGEPVWEWLATGKWVVS